MQIVIDISKDRYDEIMSMDWKNCRLIFDEELRAIHDGKALEQEPCDDCISREAALDDSGLGEFHRYDDYVKMRNYLKSLPSVTPQQKMGRWERDQFTNQPTCSACGYKVFGGQTMYCPNCGAKMQVVEG